MRIRARSTLGDDFLDVLRAAEVAIHMGRQGSMARPREGRKAVTFSEVRACACTCAPAHLQRPEGELVRRSVVGWSSTTASDHIRHWGTERPTRSTGPTGRHCEMRRKKRKMNIFTTPTGGGEVRLSSGLAVP